MPFNDDIRELQKKIAVENNRHAFGQLHMGYMPNLFKFAQSIIKNRELAEEIVSDVFIKTWQNRKALAKIENFRLYFYKSVRNTSFNYSISVKTIDNLMAIAVKKIGNAINFNLKKESGSTY